MWVERLDARELGGGRGERQPVGRGHVDGRVVPAGLGQPLGLVKAVRGDGDPDRGPILRGARDRQTELLAGELEAIQRVVRQRVGARDGRAGQEPGAGKRDDQDPQQDRRGLRKQREDRHDRVGERGPRGRHGRKDLPPHPGAGRRVQPGIPVTKAQGGRDGIAHHGVADLLEPADAAGDVLQVRGEVLPRPLGHRRD